MTAAAPATREINSCVIYSPHMYLRKKIYHVVPNPHIARDIVKENVDSSENSAIFNCI